MSETSLCYGLTVVVWVDVSGRVGWVWVVSGVALGGESCDSSVDSVEPAAVWAVRWCSAL